MSKYCPKCGNELPDEAKFCNECGYSVLVEDKKEDNLKTEETNKSEVEVSEIKSEDNLKTEETNKSEVEVSEIKSEDNLKTEETNKSEVEVSETKKEENVESSMDLGDNIKKSLSYPLLDHDKFAMIGVLSVFSCLGIICASFGLNNPVVILISFLVGILISIYLTGYNISIIKYGTYNKQFIPDFNIKNDILNFFKFYILTFVYGIIPSIIILITIFASGIIGAWTKLLPYIQQNSANIPPAIMSSFLQGIIVTIVVSIIVLIITDIFVKIGTARMIVNDSLSDGLDVIEVFHDVGKIGWFKTIGWFVIVNILNVIFLIIALGLILIPYIGIIVAAFLVFGFMRLFNSYSLGLLYRDVHIINKKEIQDEIIVSETKKL